MLTCAGPKVIEFNVRFGDPEAQVVIPMIDGELAPVLLSAAQGRLERAPAFNGLKHVGVVMASAGYPASATSGVPISGLDAAAAIDDVLVFHAGTAATPIAAGCGAVAGAKAASGRSHAVVTAGGRVLTIVGRGPTYETAIARAYAAVETIHFEGMQYRRDIGRKALTS
jgi:phosphoribosylamine--glycine ligase